MAGFFSKERADERKLKKWTKKLLNMYVQPADRQFAAQQLAEMATDASIQVILTRFERNTKNHTLDIDDKKLCHDLLVELGDRVREPILNHIRGNARHVNWALRVLQTVVEKEKIAEIIAELLEGMDAEYTRNPEKKEELVAAAADHVNERLGKALMPHIEDASERIRFHAIDALFAGGYGFAAEPIVGRLAGEETSMRVILRILDGLVECDWSVKGHRAIIEEMLPEGYAITRSGTVRRRG
jgi:hypothetical protein